MLGRIIKEYIDEKDLKQRRVADDAGMRHQMLNDILNERRKIEATEYFAICKSLNLPLDFFASKLEQDKDTA